MMTILATSIVLGQNCYMCGGCCSSSAPARLLVLLGWPQGVSHRALLLGAKPVA